MLKIPISVLDLAVVSQGGNAGTAIQGTVEVARHAESLGFSRIWMAEHHNMEHIASSATSVLIEHVASKTNSIRVGSGGIMLPNHTPLVIAEQFGTLETIHPGRIDLGLGRAPGSDQLTAMALRRNNIGTSDSFPQDVRQLQHFLSESNSGSKVRAFPGEGLTIPIWILGSSTDSAHLAAAYGLPYGFAAHFAPAQFKAAIDIYKREFRPSAQLAEPYVLACVNVMAGETNEEAELLATSLYRMFIGILTNSRSPLQPPAPLPPEFWQPEVQYHLKNMTSCSFIGDKETVRKGLFDFIEEHGVNEIMAATHIYDLNARLRSFSILREAMEN
ncbi:MAG: LLM class flavin-dependent oxidoreductase [Chitinophagaceae bacterium]|nr:MAG: LLM class flavin-dependent oxidoreductase [Chitinophagaceae bacterium]